MVLRRIFDGENCVMRSSIVCTFHHPMIRTIELRMMRWAGQVACMGEMRNAYTIFVG
jgi:hypothetical protein